MIVLAFIQWWYGAGWAEQGHAMVRRIESIADNFSLGILFKTWFAPWKQIVSYKDRNMSLDNRFRAGVDNLVSRVVGFMVRSVVMLTALLCMSGLTVIAAVLLIVWPVIPLVPVILVLAASGVQLW